MSRFNPSHIEKMRNELLKFLEGSDWERCSSSKLNKIYGVVMNKGNIEKLSTTSRIYQRNFWADLVWRYIHERITPEEINECYKDYVEVLNKE